MKEIIFSAALSYCLVELFLDSLKTGHTFAAFSVIFVLILLAIGASPIKSSKENDED